MCMDSGLDFDIDSDVVLDVESDRSSDSGFEGLDSVDDTSYESFDEVSNAGADFEDDTDSGFGFEGLEPVDDTSYKSFDEESEVMFTEFIEDVDALDISDELDDDNSLEFSESETATDLSMLDNIQDSDTIGEDIEYLDVEQDTDTSDSLGIIDTFEDIEKQFDEQIETDSEDVGTTMDITEIEATELHENVESSTGERLAEDMETFIENTNDIQQLYELRDSLVNGDVSEATIPENSESLKDPVIDSVKEETTETDWDQLALNELRDETSRLESKAVVTENEVQEVIENETDPNRLAALRESLLSDKITIETDETTDEDPPKVLTREITPEIIESRERDTKETLDNYQDDLRAYGVGEEQIEEFVEQERQKIRTEYEGLDRGDTSSNIYYQPTDWEVMASDLLNQEENFEQSNNAFDAKTETDSYLDSLNSELLESNETDDSNLVKDLVNQNVSKFVLPRNGTWSDELHIGNSNYIISDDAEIKWEKNGTHSCSGEELKEWMKEKYDVTAVKYEYNEPDFSPFEDKEIGDIYIEDMSTNRFGADGTYKYAEKIAAEKLGMSEAELRTYMSDNELTWHECADRHTIQAIPTRINTAFKHSGGISTQKSFEAISSTISSQINNEKIALRKDSVFGTTEGLSDAIKQQHKNFRRTKKQLF